MNKPPHLPRPPRLPAIDPARCTGCGRCVAACDLHLLQLDVLHWRKFSVLNDAQRCSGCSLCALRCPFDAITMQWPLSAAVAPPPRP